MALSSEMVNQKLGNEMVWNFRGSDGMIVPATESSNSVELGPFGWYVALDVCRLTLMTAEGACKQSIFSFSVILDLISSAKRYSLFPHVGEATGDISDATGMLVLSKSTWSLGTALSFCYVHPKHSNPAP